MQHKILAIVFATPAIVTVAVGANYLMRSFDIGRLNLPEHGFWGFIIGVCCLATGWVAWQGLSAMWKKM